MKKLRLITLAMAALFLAGPAAAAAPTADLHDIDWYVHVDLITGGTTLADYQDLIDETMAAANDIYEGNHGPPDTTCCTRMQRSVSVTTFGSPGDGLDVLDSSSEYTTIGGIGSGSRAFLVDSMTYCGGSAPTAIGCGQQPSCNGTPDDDPNLWFVVTLDAQEFSLPKTTAHERGHNSCLGHVEVEECALMRGGGGGACITSTECGNLQDGRTTTGGSCTCHDMGGGIESDGTACSGATGGVCSGGLCGEASGDAGVTLMAAGGPGSGSSEVTDDAILVSGLPGGWADVGNFGSEIKGLAFAHDEGILYGVIPTSGDDSLVTLNVATGSVTGTVGTIANGSNELIALAYDPGATYQPGDDRLLALETDGTFEDLLAIDPDDASDTFIGSLATGGSNGYRGLAWDSINDKLYTSSPFTDGIYEIDLSTCPFFCGVDPLTGLGVHRFDSALSFSPWTEKLYLVGTQIAVSPLGMRTMYDVIDPETLGLIATRTVASFEPGGLAIPVPEPSAWLLQASAVGFLALLGALRRRSD